jgi:hypothetical protein
LTIFVSLDAPLGLQYRCWGDHMDLEQVADQLIKDFHRHFVTFW